MANTSEPRRRAASFLVCSRLAQRIPELLRHAILTTARQGTLQHRAVIPSLPAAPTSRPPLILVGTTRRRPTSRLSHAAKGRRQSAMSDAAKRNKKPPACDYCKVRPPPLIRLARRARSSSAPSRYRPSGCCATRAHEAVRGAWRRASRASLPPPPPRPHSSRRWLTPPGLLQLYYHARRPSQADTQEAVPGWVCRVERRADHRNLEQLDVRLAPRPIFEHRASTRRRDARLTDLRRLCSPA